MSQLAQTLLNMSVLEDVLREVATNLIQQKCGGVNFMFILVVDLFNMNNTECATHTVLPLPTSKLIIEMKVCVSLRHGPLHP